VPASGAPPTFTGVIEAGACPRSGYERVGIDPLLSFKGGP
jgi:hypothetical protein